MASGRRSRILTGVLSKSRTASGSGRKGRSDGPLITRHAIVAIAATDHRRRLCLRRQRRVDLCAGLAGRLGRRRIGRSRADDGCRTRRTGGHARDRGLRVPGVRLQAQRADGRRARHLHGRVHEHRHHRPRHHFPMAARPIPPRQASRSPSTSTCPRVDCPSSAPSPGHAAAGMKGTITVGGATAEGGDDHGGPAPDTDVEADPNAPPTRSTTRPRRRVWRATSTTSTWSSKRSR